MLFRPISTHKRFHHFFFFETLWHHLNLFAQQVAFVLGLRAASGVDWAEVHERGLLGVVGAHRAGHWRCVTEAGLLPRAVGLEALQSVRQPPASRL